MTVTLDRRECLSPWQRGRHWGCVCTKGGVRKHPHAGSRNLGTDAGRGPSLSERPRPPPGPLPVLQRSVAAFILAWSGQGGRPETVAGVRGLSVPNGPAAPRGFQPRGDPAQLWDASNAVGVPGGSLGAGLAWFKRLRCPSSAPCPWTRHRISEPQCSLQKGGSFLSDQFAFTMPCDPHLHGDPGHLPSAPEDTRPRWQSLLLPPPPAPGGGSLLTQWTDVFWTFPITHGIVRHVAFTEHVFKEHCLVCEGHRLLTHPPAGGSLSCVIFGHCGRCRCGHLGASVGVDVCLFLLVDTQA